MSEQKSAQFGRASSPAEGSSSHLLSFVGGFVAICALAGVLLAAFLLPAITIMSAAAKDGVSMFNSLPTELSVAPLNQASRIEASDGSLIATFYSENRIMVPLDKIDPDLQHAVVSIEDRRFYEHNGFDLQGAFRAALSNVGGGSTQGGSTLTQQYVKNALLMDAYQKGDKQAIKDATASSLIRKLREAKLAIALEKTWSKDQILNGYLNVAQFGPSQYGVEVAAQHYFSKSAADLTPGEAALLAGITNSPNNFDPVNHPKAATKRRNQVLTDMYDQGYISSDDFKKYVDQPVQDMLKVTNFRAGCSTAGGSGFFCDYVTRMLLNDTAFGKTFEERKAKLYGGGLTIRTTLDPARQKIAEDILNRKVPADSKSGFGHSIVTVEPGTGKIIVMAENRSFNPYKDAGPGETSINYNVSEHLGGSAGFPVGSTFKPFVLTTYLKGGGSIWDTVERGWGTFNHFPAKCLPKGEWREPDGWSLADAGDTNKKERMTALDATKFSINTAYANIAMHTDLCDVAETAKSMGVLPGKFNPAKPENANASVLDIYGDTIAPSVQVIGQIQIPALDMAAAYGTFAAQGRYCAPQGITKITDSAGKDLPFTGQQCSQVLEPQIADQVAWTLMQGLSDPQGTGKGMVIPGYDAGGKTGTSSNFYHTWYVGMTRNLSTAVWFGNPSADRNPAGVMVDGEPLPKKVYGATVSLPTWHEFMTKAQQGLPSIPFPAEPAKPSGGAKNWPSSADAYQGRIDPKTGKYSQTTDDSAASERG